MNAAGGIMGTGRRAAYPVLSPWSPAVLKFIDGVFGVLRGCDVCGAAVWTEITDKCPVCALEQAAGAGLCPQVPCPPLTAVPEAV